MAASVPAAGACGHRSLAPISSPATRPPLPAAAAQPPGPSHCSECSSSKGEGRGGEGSGGERREGRGGEARSWLLRL